MLNNEIKMLNSKEEVVVLVNETGEELGVMEKLNAHQHGILHKAISIFIFNDKYEMLLQQRAKDKYHSPLLWTNACCSHPREHETYEEAAQRRLFEELGFDTKLDYIFNFIYKAEVGDGIWEHELDYVYKGFYNKEIPYNPAEVNAIKWMTIPDIEKDITKNPEQYTRWFKIIFNQYLEFIR